jgi:hypothetical protein
MISLDTFIDKDATEGIHYNLNNMFSFVDTILNYIFLWEFVVKAITLGFIVD